MFTCAGNHGLYSGSRKTAIPVRIERWGSALRAPLDERRTRRTGRRRCRVRRGSWVSLGCLASRSRCSFSGRPTTVIIQTIERLAWINTMAMFYVRRWVICCNAFIRFHANKQLFKTSGSQALSRVRSPILHWEVHHIKNECTLLRVLRDR